MIRYPNGKPYIKTKNEETPKNPKKRTKVETSVDYANRGMSLEKDIEDSNLYYLNRQMAVIHKKPTPIQIVEVDYPKRSAATIKKAYFRTPSTLDFNGVYKGKYIDFDAKETKNKTSFPLQNFHQHQIVHMKGVLEQGGICFAIIRFSDLQKTFLLDAKHIIECWDEQEKGGRKSIPFLSIEDKGFLIKEGYQLRLDYLKVIKDQYFKI